jgi:ketosteroid isomerase-like protein
MSQENVEVVRRMLHAWATGDPDTARAAYDENVVYIFPPLDAPVSHGVAAMERAVEMWRRTWDDYSVEFDELIDAGDHVVVVQTQRARGKASGIEVELTSATIYTLLGSKIVRGEVFATKEQALEILGLSE